MEDLKTKNTLEARQLHYPILNPVGDYEYWSFSIKTNTGEFIKAYLSLNELFTVPVKSSVNFIYIDKEGNEIKESLIIKSDKCVFDQDKFNISIADNYCIKHEDHYELNVLINGTGCNLKIIPKFPAWQKTKNGIISKNLLGSIFLAWNIPVPYAKIDGELFLCGEKSLISAYGSLDHAWGNQNIGKEVKYMFVGSCFLDDSVWAYHVGLMRDNVLGAKLVCIDKNGNSYSYMKDFDLKEINVRILEYVENSNNTIPKLIEIKNKKAEIDLLIDIKKQVSKDNQFRTKMKALESIDFISEVSVRKTKSKLKKLINTTNITELYMFKD